MKKLLIAHVCSFFLLSIMALPTLAADGNPQAVAELKRVKQTLVAPPFLPEHTQVAKGAPRIVEVEMVIHEKPLQIAPNASAQVMTFNGSVPGPIIVVHQDDYVELTLVNPDTNTLMHNIDFHAATGALGGGALTDVNPGEQVVLRFKATKPGVFVYHCAPGGIMTPFHVVSGMNGAIMVLPRDGIKDGDGQLVTYDRAYYIVEQDYYIPKDDAGRYKQYNSVVEAMGETIEVMRTLLPSHIVFNGQLDSLNGDKAMKAKVGEMVLFIHASANRDTRIHLIGGHGDLVYMDGSFDDAPIANLETWAVPAGSTAAMLYRFQQPGTYVYLNHNLIEAVLFGANATVEVDGGSWDNDLMEQVSPPGPILSAQ